MRVDLIKLDVEGMELETLARGNDVLRRARPILIIEFVKSDKAKLRSILGSLDYSAFGLRMDLVAIHKSDNTLNHIQSVK
jgi:hypothetical protein